MRELALENRELYKRISNLDRSTTKEKLLSYLSKEAIRNNSNEFDIPFDRRELAEYLSVERSAMSAELSALAKQGYLETSRNHFRLLKRG
jgi:DNA-binding MarR family transcriptional regulator